MTLLEYFEIKGYAVVEIAPGQYQGLPDENGVPCDDFSYDLETDKWAWPERAKSGFGLNDYLKKVVGIKEEDIPSVLNEAENTEESAEVPEEIENQERKRIPAPAEMDNEEGDFSLPPRAAGTHAVDKYYTYTMSISPSVLKWFEDQGLLYESNEQYQLEDRRIFYHNAIFVCVDKDFIVKGAVDRYLRPSRKSGTLSIKDIEGSDINYGFSRIPLSCQVLLVFEDIIEMLSYFTLAEKEGRAFTTQPFVCLNGKGIPEKTLPKALFTALKEHPRTRAVFFAAGKRIEKQAKTLCDQITETQKRRTGLILSEDESFSEELKRKYPPSIPIEDYIKQYRSSEGGNIS